MTKGTTHLGESSNGSDNVNRLVHHNDGSRSESRLQIFERIEIHPVRSRSRSSNTKSDHLVLEQSPPETEDGGGGGGGDEWREGRERTSPKG